MSATAKNKPVVKNPTDDLPVVESKTGKVLWLFNWVSGGFNDIFAHTKEEAIAEVAANNTLAADPGSFRQATNKTWQEQNRMGWMMTC